jgi:site-specific DNA recombinase
MIGLYVRVSTEDQAKHGYSIDDQLRQCRKKSMSTETKDYIDDGYSGEYLDRPALVQLRKDVKEKLITKVICYDPDRLSRNLMNQLIITEEFRKRSVDLVFVTGDYEDSPIGKLSFNIKGVIAEYEKAIINDRMSRGRREKARQGKVVKNSYLYGYDFDKEKDAYVINESEAKVVQLIFDLFTKPSQVKGINGIAVFLTKQGIPTKKGAAVWHRQVVRQMLLNKSYTGEHNQNRWDTEGMLGNKHKEKEDKVPMKVRPEEEWIHTKIPPIISEFQYEHANRLIGESKRRFAKESLRDYLLSGIVRCGECGNTMTGRRTKNWGKYELEYTDVKNYSGAKFKGCGLHVKCEELDANVWDTVLNWLNEPDQIAAAKENGEESSFEQTELERITREIEKAKNGRKRLIKLFSDGIEDLGEEEIRNELKELTEKEERLKKQYEELDRKMNTMKNMEYSKNMIQEAVDYYLNKNLEQLTLEDKKDLIRSVVKEVQVFKDHIDIHSF